MIVVKKLTKYYKRKVKKEDSFWKHLIKRDYEVVKALKEIDLSISEGEIVGYVGLNGAGKSTTIKLLTGILHPDSGSIEVFGMNPFKHRQRIVARIGVMFGQRSHLLWDLPLIHSLDLLKKIYNIPDNIYQESIELAKKYLGIGDLLKIPVRTMSLGQRIRGEFTAIMLHQPEILFLDEPTIGLDVITKNEIKKLLHYLNEEKGCTIFLTTHDLRDIEKICKRVVVLDEGRIILDDQVNNLLNKVESQFLSVTFADMRVPESLLQFEGIEVLSKDKNVARIKYDRKYYTIESLLKKLMTNYNIEGFYLEQPDLEEIILNLYKSRRNKVVV